MLAGFGAEVLATGDAFGLLAAVGAPCGLDVSLAAAWLTALSGFRVLTPPGRYEDIPLDAALPPKPCAILSAAVLP